MAMKAGELRATIDQLITKARDPRTTDREKTASMAEALAYWRELSHEGQDGSVNFNADRVNSNIQALDGCAAFEVAKQEGRLGRLASLSVEKLNEHVNQIDQEVTSYAAGDENSHKRANHIFRQMDRTWRVGGNSREFDRAKKAMQSVAEREVPTQADHYVAAEIVKKYVTKNLNKAKSAVGMTRMACALTFLKQTMPPESFRAYCNTLNALRRITSTTTEGGLSFDKTNPRCIVPEEIGTVKEVYQTARERFHDYALNDEKISPRDLALLTALRNLQEKSADGENLVVEHEALQAEIEKVQNDRRFQDAIKNKSRIELIEMAWGGNVDTLAGYTKPLSADQLQRVEEEKTRIAKEQAEELARQEEAEKKRLEELERQKQEELRKEQERLKQEEEQQRKEKERLLQEEQERERRKMQKPLSELYETQLTYMRKLADPLDQTFAILDDAEAEQSRDQKNLEFAATLVALGEIQYAIYSKKEGEPEKDPMVNLGELQQRVDTLKKDPLVKQIGKAILLDPSSNRVIRKYLEEGERKTQFSKYERGIYAVSMLAAKMYRFYDGEMEKKRKLETKFPVSEGYKRMEPEINEVISGNRNHQSAVNTVAMTVALREVEKKGGGKDTLMNWKGLQNRLLELKNDPDIKAISQSLTGPTKLREMEKTIARKPDRVTAFADMVENMYRKAQVERQKKQQNKEMKGPK